jgi:hypothetical protein
VASRSSKSPVKAVFYVALFKSYSCINQDFAQRKAYGEFFSISRE